MFEYVNRKFFINGEHANYETVVQTANHEYKMKKTWRVVALVAIAIAILFLTPIGSGLGKLFRNFWEDTKSFVSEYPWLLFAIVVGLAFWLGYKYRDSIKNHRATSSTIAKSKDTSAKISSGLAKIVHNAKGSKVTPDNSHPGGAK